MRKKVFFYVLLLFCLFSSPVLAMGIEGQTQANIGFTQGPESKNKESMKLPKTNEQEKNYKLIGFSIIVLSVMGMYRQLNKLQEI